jgi:hypothetical protein
LITVPQIRRVHAQSRNSGIRLPESLPVAYRYVGRAVGHRSSAVL